MLGERAIRQVVADPHNCWAWYELAKELGAESLGPMADAVGWTLLKRHQSAADAGLALKLDKYADGFLCDHGELLENLKISESAPLWRERARGKPESRPEQRAEAAPHPPRQAGGLADVGVDIGGT